MDIKIGDRVTFDSDEGIQIGYVNSLRRDLGNGELNAWVELDHQWPGVFRAVPLSAILTSDFFGPPSTMHFRNHSAKAIEEFNRLYLGNFETVRTDEIRDAANAVDDNRNLTPTSEPLTHLQRKDLHHVV